MSDARTATSAALSAAAESPPADYRLVLPDGWWRIDLDPDRREASISALVERQFRGVDDAPHLKLQAKEQLLEQAVTAYHNGGVELYLSLQTAGPLPLAASLAVTLVPPSEDGAVLDPEDLAAELSRDLPDVTLVELGVGPAVRCRRRTVPAPDDPTGNSLPVTDLDLYVPVPASSAYLLLSFSTPLDPIADAMVELFDAIAMTLRWIP